MADAEQQTISIGSYNTLHPHYAEKWNDKEGRPENGKVFLLGEDRHFMRRIMVKSM